MSLEIIDNFAMSIAVTTLVIAITKSIVDFFKLKENQKSVKKAEKEAFAFDNNSIKEQVDLLYESHDGLQEKAEEIRKIVEDSQNALNMGRLFNLYSKQIEKYQQETRARASWSFIFAIISMFAGMGFLFWGGSFILSETGENHVTAGASISAIGGVISAYITKTFLDVHKLSLTQLNKYFKQPVINDNILMAQRLADDVDDDTVRKQSYEKIIESITNLINSTTNTTKA